MFCTNIMYKHLTTKYLPTSGAICQFLKLSIPQNFLLGNGSTCLLRFRLLSTPRSVVHLPQSIQQRWNPSTCDIEEDKSERRKHSTRPGLNYAAPPGRAWPSAMTEEASGTLLRRAMIGRGFQCSTNTETEAWPPVTRRVERKARARVGPDPTWPDPTRPDATAIQLVEQPVHGASEAPAHPVILHMGEP